MFIHHTVHPDNAKYMGRNIGEIASERGQSPWDAVVEIALLDELQTSFGPPGTDEPDATWKARVEVWRDPRAVVGASDAGAHLDLFLTANYTTTLLGEAVVKRQLLPLEEAINYLTAVPADLYGFVDRGRIKVGAFADLVVLDEHNVGSNETTFKSDLPAGGTRLYADAHGIKSVICNGQEIVCNGEFTSARPGSILRTGVHTTANM
jgi:N-acyl-D-aspartate/D-glutamate deacylase